MTADIRARLVHFYGEPVVAFAQRKGMDVCVLHKELRNIGVDVDTWSTPPVGLFVVKERMVYMRHVSDVSLTHEWGHVIDAALGDGEYISYREPRVRDAFFRATFFVSPYASIGLDEFVAEGFRSFCEANDLDCPWPTVSKARLKECSPGLYDFIEATFRELSMLHNAA
jgi:hypothetical protein